LRRPKLSNEEVKRLMKKKKKKKKKKTVNFLDIASPVCHCFFTAFVVCKLTEGKYFWLDTALFFFDSSGRLSSQ
jgi:protein-disulfide isomerase